MSQPVQHQNVYRGRAPVASLNDQMKNELLELYRRSDTLLRELSTVRRRMDELHSNGEHAAQSKLGISDTGA